MSEEQQPHGDLQRERNRDRSRTKAARNRRKRERTKAEIARRIQKDERNSE